MPDSSIISWEGLLCAAAEQGVEILKIVLRGDFGAGRDIFNIQSVHIHQYLLENVHIFQDSLGGIMRALFDREVVRFVMSYLQILRREISYGTDK
jgi:hypothetical protein